MREYEEYAAWRDEGGDPAGAGDLFPGVPAEVLDTWSAVYELDEHIIGRAATGSR